MQAGSLDEAIYRGAFSTRKHQTVNPLQVVWSKDYAGMDIDISEHRMMFTDIALQSEDAEPYHPLDARSSFSGMDEISTPFMAFPSPLDTLAMTEGLL